MIRKQVSLSTSALPSSEQTGGARLLAPTQACAHFALALFPPAYHMVSLAGDAARMVNLSLM